MSNRQLEVQDTVERNTWVCFLFSQGRSQVSIARWFKVSKQCINQILKKNYANYKAGLPVGGIIIKPPQTSSVQRDASHSRLNRIKDLARDIYLIFGGK